MNRSDYKLISDAIFEVRNMIKKDDFVGDNIDVLALCVGKLTTTFMKIDRDFNAIAFMRACMLTKADA